MNKISIITPLYYGKKHLPKLSEMISICAKEAANVASVEWIISNDAPDETIDENISANGVSCIVLNTNVNRGIQGARVTGLNEATGEYVQFLDQDDYIYPNWIRSQLEAVGDYDAVVCDAIYDGRPMYGTNGIKPSLKECVSREYNVDKHIGFTMGQALIKREKISSRWKENWLKTNCCDDHYLWLCMFAEGCRFNTNREILYEHINTGRNQSENIHVFIKSTHEMLQKIYELNVFDAKEMQRLIRAREAHIEEACADIEFIKKREQIYKRLTECHEGKPLNLSHKLIEEETAIYGYAMGIHLARALSANEIKVSCILDKNAKKLLCELPVYEKENTPSPVRCVINTLLKKENTAEINMFYKNRNIKIIDIWELLNKE